MQFFQLGPEAGFKQVGLHQRRRPHDRARLRIRQLRRQRHPRPGEAATDRPQQLQQLVATAAASQPADSCPRKFKLDFQLVQKVQRRRKGLERNDVNVADVDASRAVATIPEADGHLALRLRLRPGHDVVGALLELLRDGQPEVHQEAVRHLGPLGQGLLLELQHRPRRRETPRNARRQRTNEKRRRRFGRSVDEWRRIVGVARDARNVTQRETRDAKQQKNVIPFNETETAKVLELKNERQEDEQLKFPFCTFRVQKKLFFSTKGEKTCFLLLFSESIF